MAGLEERLSKLESILNRLFCCDTNQFTGPPGLQGEPGLDGGQGPQGVPGPIGPAGLTWQGEWIPCNVYQQNDAVGFNGASYYVTCEDSGVTEACESPYDNTSCWALLANMGATGPMGPQGITGTAGAKGIDGANSLRWVAGTTYMGYNSIPNTFNFNTNSLPILNTIILSVKESHGVNVGAWLLNIANKVSPISFVQVQVTDSLDNSIFGTYNVTGIIDSGLPGNSSFLVISMTPISGNGDIVSGREYTISWNYSKQGIQGTPGPQGIPGVQGIQGITGPQGVQGIPGAGVTSKTYGTVYTAYNPYSTLVYDFNDVYTQDVDQGILLPNATIIGTEIVLFSTLDNSPFEVFTNDTETLVSIRTKNLDEVVAALTVFPGDTYRFTLIDLVDDGKGGFEPLWFSESINGIPYKYNNNNLVELGFDILTTAQDLTLSPLSASFLNSNYGPIRGITVYCPNLNLAYTNVGGGYWSQTSIVTVL